MTDPKPTNNSRDVQITIRGVEYRSIAAAARACGVSYSRLYLAVARGPAAVEALVAENDEAPA